MGAWRGTGVVSADGLAQARLHAHYAAQWLARVARNYLPKAEDDSHTALTWDSGHQTLLTHTIEGGRGDFRFGLRIADLCLLTLADWDIAPVPIKGHNERQFEAWISACLLEQNVDRDLALNFRPLPYKMPDHPIAKGGTYGNRVSEEALHELAAWYEGAANLLANGPGKEIGASPIRVWQHHLGSDRPGPRAFHRRGSIAGGRELRGALFIRRPLARPGRGGACQSYPRAIGTRTGLRVQFWKRAT